MRALESAALCDLDGSVKGHSVSVQMIVKILAEFAIAADFHF
jgi:hypothetical protein